MSFIKNGASFWSVKNTGRFFVLGAVITTAFIFSGNAAMAQTACDPSLVGTNQFVGCLWKWNEASGVPTSPIVGSPVGPAPQGATFSGIAPTTFNALQKIWAGGGEASTGPDYFSAQWKGDFTFAPGTYRFVVFGNNGVRVRFKDINGSNVENKLNAWPNPIGTEFSFTQTFCSQVTKRIEIDYYEEIGNAAIIFRWEPARGGANQFQGCLWNWSGTSVPSSPEDGVTAGPAVSGPVFLNPSSTSFESLRSIWGAGGPNSFTGTDQFSGQWKGEFKFNPGTYRFYAFHNNGVRIKMEATPSTNPGLQTVVDDWVSGVARENSFVRTFDSPTTVFLQLDYFEDIGNAGIIFRWDRLPSCQFQETVGSNQLVGCLWDWRSSTVAPSTPEDGVLGGVAPSGTIATTDPVAASFNALSFNWSRNFNSFTGPDTLSARWKGSFKMATGTYKFSFVGPGGVRVRLGTRTILDDWRDGPSRERAIIVPVTSVAPTQITVEHFRGALVGDQVRFGWVPSVQCLP